MENSKEFQQIIELVDIVNRHKVKHIEVIGNPKSSHVPPSRYWEFYEQMVDGNFEKDQDAIAYFKLENNERSYKKLRKGVISRLLDTLFFIDLSSDSLDLYEKNTYAIKKKYVVLQILRSRRARILPIELSKEILRKALIFHLTDVALYCAAALQAYCSRDPQLQNEYEKYKNIKWLQYEILGVELKAAEYYNEFIFPYVSKKSSKTQRVDLAIKYVNELEKVEEKLRSETYYRYLCIMKIFVPMSQYDWKETIRVATEVIAFYDKHDYFPKTIVSYLLQNKIVAEIMLSKYSDAKKDLDEAIKYIPVYSRSWFKVKELEVMLYFHSKDYKSCWDLIKTAIRHNRFQSITQVNKETWYIFNAYINFVQMIDKVELSPREKGELKKFRLAKFLNEVPTFSKDKKGMNISILIVQVLILLVEEKYDDLDLRIDALMKYKSRRLSEVGQRTQTFLKMIQCLQRGSYLKEKVMKKAKPYLEQLKTMPQSIAEQSHELEVISFDVLWGYVGEVL